MNKKVYLSLTETESLIFKKTLVVPVSRLKIEQAQKDFSIVVFVDAENLVEFKNQLIIVFGAIDGFEIPKQEKNLFFNHLRIPKGLIKFSDRNYRDSTSENKDELNFPKSSDLFGEIALYSFIRRGFLECYSLAQNEDISKNYTQQTFEILNQTNELNKFKKNFIKEIISYGTYPTKEKNDGNFHPEPEKRFGWWGAYILNYLKKNHKLKESKFDSVRSWFINFKNKDNFGSIKRAVDDVPDIVYGDFEFIIGYYFAASFYEKIEANDYSLLIEILKKINLVKNSKVIFWSIFFQSIFKDDLDFLYGIPSLRNQLYTLELNILCLIEPRLEIETSIIKKVSIDKKKRAAEYLQFKDGEKSVEPKFISETEVKMLFQNTFSNENISNVGLAENKFSLAHLIANTFNFKENNLYLKLARKPKEITFYLNSNSKVKEWLKEMKLKNKPLHKSVLKSKKALVGFFREDSYEKSLFKVYEMLFASCREKLPFKRIVFVWLVNEKVEIIQSPQFESKRKEWEKYFQSKFDRDIILLIKNEQIYKDGEIKRNLKHSLNKYKINNIELIDENIDGKIINWLLSVNNEYIVDSARQNYYFFNDLKDI